MSKSSQFRKLVIEFGRVSREENPVHQLGFSLLIRGLLLYSNSWGRKCKKGDHILKPSCVLTGFVNCVLSVIEDESKTIPDSKFYSLVVQMRALLPKGGSENLKKSEGKTALFILAGLISTVGGSIGLIVASIPSDSKIYFQLVDLGGILLFRLPFELIKLTCVPCSLSKVLNLIDAALEHVGLQFQKDVKGIFDGLKRLSDVAKCSRSVAVGSKDFPHKRELISLSKALLKS